MTLDTTTRIVPTCLDPRYDKVTFLSAAGEIWPCCFLARKEIHESLATWLARHGGNLEDFRYNAPFGEVSNRPAWQTIRTSLRPENQEWAFSECWDICGKYLKSSNDNSSMHRVIVVSKRE